MQVAYSHPAGVNLSVATIVSPGRLSLHSNWVDQAWRSKAACTQPGSFKPVWPHVVWLPCCRPLHPAIWHHALRQPFWSEFMEFVSKVQSRDVFHLRSSTLSSFCFCPLKPLSSIQTISLPFWKAVKAYTLGLHYIDNSTSKLHYMSCGYQIKNFWIHILCRVLSKI